MSSTDEEEFDLSLYSDLTPIPQDDGSYPLAAIAYPPAYSQAMDYLRAVMAAEEYSERVLNLTGEIIGMNPAHYTVWGLRFKCLQALEKEKWDGKGDRWEGWEDELEWVMGVARIYEKNYQIWHHRQLIVSHLGDPLNERANSAEMFARDSKNYHVWTFRQWLVSRFQLYDKEELEFVEKLIQDDVRNNSAWNHRYFLMTKGKMLDGRQEEEVSWVKKKIEAACQNASSWNYLKGILKYTKISLGTLKEFCEEFTKEGEVRSSHALDILAEIYAEEKEVDKAGQALDALATTYDPIRRNYWMYRKRMLGSTSAVTA